MNPQSLEDFFSTFLTWHPARIETFSELICAMIKAKTVTIKELALNMGCSENLGARIAKIDRLLLQQEYDFTVMGQILLKLLKTQDKVRIAIDRTNWQFGKKNLNFFVAGIIKGNMSIPFCWILLDKKGNSSTDERKLLIEEVLKIIPVEKIEVILADREFIGEEWLAFLNDTKEIPFAIRVKKSEHILDEKGRKIKLQDYFFGMKNREFRTVTTRIYKTPIHITCLHMEKEQLFLASNVFVGEEALRAYKQRWSIERSFRSLKTSGFNIEDTHITDQKKLAKLFTTASLALAICVIAGEIKNQIKPIKIKKHGRALYSCFTYGFDLLKDYFCNPGNQRLLYLVGLLQNYIFEVFK